MRRTICYLLIWTAALHSTGRIFAAEAALPTVGTPIARVSFTTFPPWSFKDRAGRYTGVLVEYLRDLAKDVGLALREEDVPIARLHHSLRQGKVDLFFSKVPESGFDCCVSLGKALESETVVLGRKNGPAWDASRPAGHSICRTGLSGYQIPGFRMFDADSLATCVRMVSRDRLPFLIGERHSLTRSLLAETSDVSSLFATPLVVDKQEFHFFVSRALDQTSFGPLIRKAITHRKLIDYINRFAEAKL